MKTWHTASGPWDAAARLGIKVVSFGLHQALTPEQKKQLWFWTTRQLGPRAVLGSALFRQSEHRSSGKPKYAYFATRRLLDELGPGRSAIGVSLPVEECLATEARVSGRTGRSAARSAPA